MVADVGHMEVLVFEKVVLVHLYQSLDRKYQTQSLENHKEEDCTLSPEDYREVGHADQILLQEVLGKLHILVLPLWEGDWEMSQLHMKHHNLVHILTHIHMGRLEESLGYHILEISEHYTRLQNHLSPLLGTGHSSSPMLPRTGSSIQCM